ncbi:sugar transferase [Cohnella boryungensis]|jgi:O-antigen biosynthesis protein WbqP|uniref:Sugar transferase n=1 Tax=Cohnella boryungensis TaxID=768479 RepID=A0ABV8S7E0_9BACL
MKRVIDILLAMLAIIIFSPLLILITLIIKLESPGPVIFKQRRIGSGGNPFWIYKFRTMRIDTPELPTHLLKSPDRYITRIGRLLRKSSLDELPQLLNILIGNMSIVGPRPALHNQHDLIVLRDRLGVSRLTPGLTGWAQINGRDDITDEQKAELDHYYLKHHSLFFDLKIMGLTMISVVLSKGVKD